jgi:hypothetical protein
VEVFVSEGFNRDYDDSDEPIAGREVREIINLFKIIARELGRIADRLPPITPPPTAPTPTRTSFTEITMLPTIGGNTQIFTGTFVPAGSVPPTDAVYAVTSNDPAVSPTVDPTGLIVTGPLPAGWVESTTTPLAYTRTASSVSVPTWTLSDIITPSALPAGLPTSTTFVQTT